MPSEPVPSEHPDTHDQDVPAEATTQAVSPVAPELTEEQTPAAQSTPEAPASSAPASSQPAPPQPEASQGAAPDDDAPLLIVKPNIRGCWPEILGALTFIGVLYYLSGLIVQGYADMFTSATVDKIYQFNAAVNKSGFWLTISAAVALYLRILYVQHNEKLFLGNTYVELHRGIIARKRTRVSLDHIRSVDTDQKFIDRLLNIGSVQVATAGTGEKEVAVSRILDPIEVRNIINKQRKSASNSDTPYNTQPHGM
jgi:membrane protein YdbS with pleckstrin-like domain